MDSRINLLVRGFSFFLRKGGLIINILKKNVILVLTSQIAARSST